MVNNETLNFLVEITPDMLSALVQSGSLELSSSHSRLCVPMIRRFYNKMLEGGDFWSIRVDDGVIIDGHHRYVASRLAEINIQSIPSNKTSATIVTPWESVTFVFDEDWDFPVAPIKIGSESINIA